MTESRLSNEELERALQTITRWGDEVDAWTNPAAQIRAHIATLQREADGKAEEFDTNVNRLKACEHIAEGDDEWPQLRNLCPSTAAVASLRDAYTASKREAEEAREAHVEDNNQWQLDYNELAREADEMREALRGLLALFGDAHDDDEACVVRARAALKALPQQERASNELAKQDGV